MGQFVVEVDIARPPGEVFSYLTNYANEAIWQQHVSEVRLEPPGETKVGTRAHKARRTPMGLQRFITEVTSLDAAALSWSDRVITGSFAGTTGQWLVSPAGGGSSVHLNVVMDAKGAWRLLLPIITRSARDDLIAEFANLKRILEG